MMILKSLLQSATLALKPITPTPQLEAEILLAYALNIPRIKLWTQNEQSLTREQMQQFETLLARRVKHEPLAYLIESKEFWTFRLKVTSATLIPREETELLVRESLQRTPQHILDLGTGSGAIALALASELPQSHVIAVDKSSTALEIAVYNAQQLKINNIKFILSDWFNNIPSQKFDLIVSNPPYIDYEDPALEESVKQFEPPAAYFAKNHGLSDIQMIVAQAPSFLTQNGWLLLEHGYQQGALVRDILQQAGFQAVSTIQDFNQLDRVTMGRYK
jgi:release factor glutamine methyltransferase